MRQKLPHPLGEQNCSSGYLGRVLREFELTSDTLTSVACCVNLNYRKTPREAGNTVRFRSSVINLGMDLFHSITRSLVHPHNRLPQVAEGQIEQKRLLGRSITHRVSKAAAVKRVRRKLIASGECRPFECAAAAAATAANASRHLTAAIQVGRLPAEGARSDKQAFVTLCGSRQTSPTRPVMQREQAESV